MLSIGQLSKHIAEAFGLTIKDIQSNSSAHLIVAAKSFVAFYSQKITPNKDAVMNYLCLSRQSYYVAIRRYFDLLYNPLYSKIAAEVEQFIMNNI